MVIFRCSYVDATGFEPATSASRIEHCFLYTKS